MKSPYSPTILSGLLIGTSYIPFPPWAIFFCFVPLWSTWLSAMRARDVFFTGWVAQFVLTLIGFNWVAHTVHEFGHLPWPFAILILFAFCGISTLSIPVFGALWFWYVRQFKLNEPARIIMLPVFLSVGQRTFPMIFDWHFGYTWLWAKFPAYHLADTVGFIGLADIGLFFNAFVLLAWRRRQARWLAVPIATFALLNIIGIFKARALPTPDDHRRFLVVQANIDNEEKLYAEQGSNFRFTVLNRFWNLTEQGLKADGPVDFAVWPETAFPDVIEDRNLSGPFAEELKNRVRATNVSLITGAYSHMRENGRLTNSFFLLNREGQWADHPYHKTMLLAFGEYFPMADYFPRLRTWFPEVADFGRGPGPTVLHAPNLLIGAQICYEGLFDWFSRGLANRGAEILVNLTNDSWYGTWQEPFQHGWMTLARAVEVRRPLVRATNTGISMVALASGEVLEPSPGATAWAHTYDVPYVRAPKPTLFMGFGFWLVPTLLGMTLLIAPFISRHL